MGDRDVAGVKLRLDGRGDGLAAAHRVELPREAYLMDLDGFLGGVVANASDRLLVEYTLDGAVNRAKVIRRAALTALFERKSASWNLSFSPVGTAVGLEICRRFNDQPAPARFFVAIGPNAGPWRLQEIDTCTGAIVDEHVATAGQLDATWRALGLIEANKLNTDWLRRPK